MRAELERTLKEPPIWISFAVCFATLMGYSLAYWVGASLAGEWMEYRESALQLSLGGIFFGGFMLLHPFCASLAHSTSQIDDARSGMMQWCAIRGTVLKYVRIKVVTCMISAAVAASSAFILHAILWNIIAIPVNPMMYPNHTIYFSNECVFLEWYTVCYGLPVYIEMMLGIAFTASVWAVVALAISIWIPDKLLTVTIPSFLYYLWNADIVFYFTGVKTPHPAILFNDGLTVEKAMISVASYLIVLALALGGYYAGCQRRCQNA
ncbi:MAG: hypothetical protein ACI3W5_01015 [Faecousia sp.]